MKLDPDVIDELTVHPGQPAGLDHRSTDSTTTDWLGAAGKKRDLRRRRRMRRDRTRTRAQRRRGHRRQRLRRRTARQLLHADLRVILTDLPAVIAGFGAHTRNRCTAPPSMTSAEHFAQGPMGLKVATTCHFERLTGNVARIGALTDIADVIAGTAGTRIAATDRRPAAQAEVGGVPLRTWTGPAWSPKASCTG